MSGCLFIENGITWVCNNSDYVMGAFVVLIAALSVAEFIHGVYKRHDISRQQPKRCRHRRKPFHKSTYEVQSRAAAAFEKLSDDERKRKLQSMLIDSALSGIDDILIPNGLNITSDMMDDAFSRLISDDWRAVAAGLSGFQLSMTSKSPSDEFSQHVTSIKIMYDAGSKGDTLSRMPKTFDAVARMSHDARDACGLSDAKCIRYVHDAIARSCSYDKDGYRKDAKINETPSSVYDVFVNHKAICEGYSRALQTVSLYLGIPCILVSSKSMNHIWDMVKIEGSWYHVDVTDDVSPEGTEPTRVFLLRSDDSMRALGHEKWSRDVVGTSELPLPTTPQSDYHAGANDFSEWH